MKEDPDPETQRYFVDTVWERRRWKREIVDPWLIHTIMIEHIHTTLHNQ